MPGMMGPNPKAWLRLLALGCLIPPVCVVMAKVMMHSCRNAVLTSGQGELAFSACSVGPRPGSI